jgi:hypothetical protein
LEKIPVALNSWNDLIAQASDLFGGGFDSKREQKEVVFLKPEEWGPAHFDTGLQELIRPLFDASGAAIQMRMQFTPQTESAIKKLESYSPSGETGVLGLLRMGPQGLFLIPIAIHEKGSVFNLTLDGKSKKQKKSSKTPAKKRDAGEESPPTAEPDKEVEQDNDTKEIDSDTRIGTLLTALGSELEAFAEEGMNVGLDLSSLRGLAARAESVGLQACSHCCRRLLEELQPSNPDDEKNPDTAARALLRAYYVCRLTSIQEAITATGVGYTEPDRDPE